jgi:predicted O-linked N-acetylglucosamine transferase (SPINDLY family)/ADP-heptose:LPS heptosyltransferase
MREELEEAASCFRRAVEIKPDFLLARKNLLVALCKLESHHRGAGDWADAQRYMDEALRLQPSPHLRFAAATLLPAIYQSVGEIESWRKRLSDNLRHLQQEGFAAELTSEVPSLFYLAYQGLNDRDLQVAAARLLSAPPLPRRNNPQRQRAGKIKIGFISRFFRDHTIGQLFGGMIAGLARDVFSVTVLSIGKYADATAKSIRARVDCFVELSDNDLQEARNLIGQEDLDVLFFTDIGMEPLSYALAFSRFAPVQCVTWGHPATTGIDTIDYFISSQLLESEEADEHYTEHLVRLETLPIYYHRPTLPTPLRGRDYFHLPEAAHVYGCPQSLFKLHPEFDDVLGEILRRDPRGILVLVQGMHRSWRELLSRRFATTIPDVFDRVRFLSSMPRTDFLNLLVCCDVLLDPLHFGGGNTSYEGLAFGVPIVTLPSSFLKGRITQALYRQMNVLDCVVKNRAEYIEKAVHLGCDAAYREAVRRRILSANSVLYENSAGVRELEKFFMGAVFQARGAAGDGPALIGVSQCSHADAQEVPLVSHPFATENGDARKAVTAPNDSYARALQHQAMGNREEAEALCRRILDDDPVNANALNLLGMLAHQSGRNDIAIDYLRRAVAANPRDGMLPYNLGVAYQVLGRAAEAIASYQVALRLNPNHAEAHNNLGRAFLGQGNREAARGCFEHAVRLRPEFAEAQNNLGVVLRDERKLEQALVCFRRAAQSAPEQPDYHSNLANLLTQQGAPEEALPHYQEAIRLQPHHAAHHSNLGNVFVLLGRPEEAEAACREALRLQPNFANAMHNLAITRSLQGHLDEAIAWNAQALRLEPGHAGAHNCEALWSLQKGDFEQGWREYNWRWDIPNAVPRDFAQPIWDGSSFTGRSILLHAEQGIGDTLQFIRYAPLVKERGGTVIVEAQTARLVPLLRRCPGVDQVVACGTDLPTFDAHSPLLELPRIFGTTLANIPARVPYLFAEPHLVEFWQHELGQGGALKIGIAWQGNARFPGDRLRSIPLREFAPIARREGIRLFSLQQFHGREQLDALRGDFHVNDLAGRLDASAAFVDTAAVMMNLDLVITSDTAIAHLAGALGVPVWVALGVGADWRWLVEREDSPWYPTMRLFRQQRLHCWKDVFERMADSLPARSGAPSPTTVAGLWSQALAQFQARRFLEAEELCRQLLDVEPCHADAVNLLGMLTHQAGDNDRACENLRHAIRLSPDNAGFHYNLGVALHVLGKLDDATASYREAVQRQPAHPDAHHNLAMVLRQQGELDAAVVEFRAAIKVRPDHAEAHHNLGLTLIALGNLGDGVDHLRAMLQARPDDIQGHHNLGLALVGLGRIDEALSQFERVLTLRPDEPETRFCRSLILLLKGDFARGWTEYEWRWQSHNASRRRHPQPLWDGSLLSGKTILLYAEQGLGDTLQFIRYARQVKQRGGTVIVECQAALVPLLSHCPGIDRAVAVGAALPHIDVQAPLLSLPQLFQTDLSNVPNDVPYVHVDPRLTEHWREKLLAVSVGQNANPGWPASPFKIGIAWQGDASFLWDRWRSIPLTSFGLLASIPGIRLVSLQVGKGREQLAEVKDGFAVVDLGQQLDQQAGAFMDTAAVMKNLDLVIASDSAVAHLAGALGVPVWVPLSYSADWRWLLDREDSPWYPSMRLFRQARLGDWGEVFQRIAAALREAVFQRIAGELRRTLGLSSKTESIQVEIAPGELVDKITILEIKRARIRDATKLRNVHAELTTLNASRDQGLPPSDRLTALTAELKKVNEALWEIEDEIRICERGQDFSSRFIELARSVYHQNDRRAVLKRHINELLGSKLIEEKAYVDYRAPGGRASPATKDAPGGVCLSTICILTYGDHLPYFRRCLDSVLEHTPLGEIELRLGFNNAPASFNWARRRLGSESIPQDTANLSEDVQRTTFRSPNGTTVRLWNSPVNLYKEPMARFMYHDVRLDTDYVIWFDDDSYVEAGWWQALCEIFRQKIDYIGQSWWADYFPGQLAMIEAQPWYRAVPIPLREGNPGVEFMTGGFMAVRSQRIREANFPDTTFAWKDDTLKQYGGDTLLGEIAHQLGWTRAVHDVNIKVNVDLQGRHPAPRRGGTGRQFGSDVDIVLS